MEKKLYVMFCYIEDVGGGQNYVNTKVRWLEERGWTVVVFSPYCKDENATIPWEYLKKYKKNRIHELIKSPEFFGKKRTKKVLNEMCVRCAGDYDEKIVESHTDYFAEWGELLAQRIDAKHICFLLDERLEFYGAKEFLYFKYLRDEVAGISESSMYRLFKGYKDIISEKNHILGAAHDESVINYNVRSIDKIEKCDWNIAYVGRDKQYVSNILKDILKLADKYPSKKINFIVLGEIKNLGEMKKKNNIICTELGFLTPIPKTFFSKIDVAIAGSGCARICFNEKIPTIVADAGTCMASGILGYTVGSTLFNENIGQSYISLLEDILIKDILKDKKVKYVLTSLPVDTYFEEHEEFINNSSTLKEYFDFIEKPQKNYTRKERLIYYLNHYYPKLFKILVNIKHFLEGGQR